MKSAGQSRSNRQASIALDRNSPLPLYQQIKPHLVRIADDRRRDHGRFPSESELTRLFGVSRMTVRQAIQELVDEGVLHRRRGAGTFVTEPAVEAPTGAPSELGEEWPARAGEMRIEPLVFEVRPCPADAAAALSLESGTAIRYVSRLRLVENVPIAIDDRYIPLEFTRGMDGSGTSRSILLQLWERVDLSRGELELEAIGATEREARWLRIPSGTPVMRRRMRYLAADGRVVVSGVSFYRADLVRYAIQLSLSHRLRLRADPFGFSSELPGDARLRREVGPRLR